jgi:hypothetical protein
MDTASNTVIPTESWAALPIGTRVRNLVAYDFYYSRLPYLSFERSESIWKLTHGVVIPAPTPHKEAAFYRFMLCDDGKVRQVRRDNLAPVSWQESQ